MKYKTTRKAINEGYLNKICIGYCDLQALLSHEQATAYTTRREGWACDIYSFGNTAIVTGYAPFGNIRPDWQTIEKYEREAKTIKNDYSLEWNDKTDKLKTLIDQFISEVLVSC